MAGDVRLIRSPISVTGMVLTTISAVVFLVVFLADLFGLHTNPYLGIVFFLVLPTLFIVGLLLIPLGAWIERRRRKAGKPPSSASWPRIDLNDQRQRRIAITVFALTMANLVIVSLAAFKGVEYMDTVGFCGQVCHAPMKVEMLPHERGQHARTTCVLCHVGPTARSFIASKISGTRRLAGVATGNYSRPITATPDELVPSVDTCERCHSSATLHGQVMRRVVEYADDEKNTESVTTLELHVGGGPDGRGGLAAGIHWHANPANRIEYIASDEGRQTIPYVKLTDASGAVTEYVVDGTAADVMAKGARHQMECTDCHNRVGHPIAGTPERAVSEAMRRGDIPKTLPFVHREAVKALQGTYASEEAARDEIARALRDFYKSDQPQAAAGVFDLYRRSVFPDMKVKFGTYPSNIGHMDSAGCFRCHDDNHKSRDGKTIKQDCETCHTIQQ